MIERRAFLCGAILTLAAPRAAHAQPAGKVPRVGLLVMARNPGVEDAFPRRLQDLVYVEGRSVSIEWRSADGRGDRLSPLAAELIQLGVDVIVAAGPESRVAAMKATSTIPIVVVGGADPVTEGWAGSLARPGGHVTGFTVTHPEMRAKKLEFLQEMILGLSRVGELRDGGASVAMRISASNPSVDLRVIDVRLPADFDRAFRQAILDRRQALIVVETAMVFAYRTEIAERALKSRLPAIGEWKPSAIAGYLASLADLLRRAATYVDKFLKGVRAGDLPVERPTKFELVINPKTAKALGLTIPPSLLARADQVLE